MTETVYLHSNKETMWELGEKLGLKDEAVMMFRHALCEVKFEIEVDPMTGKATILKVDGKELKK